MVYIPFASLLGLQAALQPLVHKQPAPEVAMLQGASYYDPRNKGGSLLDHDSGSGLGEPLNVNISPIYSGTERLKKKNQTNLGYHFRPQLSMGHLRWRFLTPCKRARIVGCSWAIYYICAVS